MQTLTKQTAQKINEQSTDKKQIDPAKKRYTKQINWYQHISLQETNKLYYWQQTNLTYAR